MVCVIFEHHLYPNYDSFKVVYSWWWYCLQKELWYPNHIVTPTSIGSMVSHMECEQAYCIRLAILCILQEITPNNFLLWIWFLSIGRHQVEALLMRFTLLSMPYKISTWSYRSAITDFLFISLILCAVSSILSMLLWLWLLCARSGFYFTWLFFIVVFLTLCSTSYWNKLSYVN